MTHSNTIYFDIETGPASDADLEAVMPEFSAPSNWVDPKKIAACIEEKKSEWKQRAALDATTGMVLCVGILDAAGKFICLDGDGDEKKLLQDWTDFVQENKTSTFIGYSSNSFDIPFLVRRAVFHGVLPCVGWSWNPHRADQWVDLRALWQLGDRQYSMGGMNGLSKFLRVGEKLGSGADFAGLWAVDKPAALDYLKRDLELCRDIARKMFVDVGPVDVF